MNFISKLCAAAILAWLPNSNATSAEEAKLVPKCGGEYGLCGYMLSGTETFAIEQKFERAFHFHDGLAGVRTNGRFGFIDTQGRLVIEPNFDVVGDFYQGLAEIIIGNKAGLIDRFGKIVVKPQFARAVPFTKNVALVRKGDWKSKYYRGYERLPGVRDTPLGFNHFHLYRIESEFFSKQTYKFQVFETTGRGLIWASDAKPRDPSYGLLNAQGEWRVEPRFLNAQKLLSDRAIVWDPNHKRGMVDQDGAVVIEPEYDRLIIYPGPHLIARSDNRSILIDRNGVRLTNFWFDKFEPAYKTVAPRVSLDGKWFSLDANWKKIPDQLDGNVISECPGGLKISLKSGKFQLSGKNGSIASGLLFDRVEHKSSVIRGNGNSSQNQYEPACSKPIYVSIDQHYGFVTPDGDLLFERLLFDSVHGFQGGYAIVRYRGKWGLIDEQGHYRLHPKFDSLWRPKNHKIYRAELDGRVFWLNVNGQEVAEPKPSASVRASHLRCGNGNLIFQSNTLWGIRTKSGDTILEPKYRAVSCFFQGIAWVANDEMKHWCPVGPDGKERDFPKCRKYQPTLFWSHSRQASMHTDPYESSVLWNRAYRDFGLGVSDQAPKMVPSGQF